MYIQSHIIPKLAFFIKVRLHKQRNGDFSSNMATMSITDSPSNSGGAQYQQQAIHFVSAPSSIGPSPGTPSSAGMEFKEYKYSPPIYAYGQLLQHHHVGPHLQFSGGEPRGGDEQQQSPPQQQHVQQQQQFGGGHHLGGAIQIGGTHQQQQPSCSSASSAILYGQQQPAALAPISAYGFGLHQPPIDQPGAVPSSRSVHTFWIFSSFSPP
jgi:hypothetical protein